MKGSAQTLVDVGGRCYPYFLQQFGLQEWDIADGPDAVAGDDVRRKVPLTGHRARAEVHRRRRPEARPPQDADRHAGHEDHRTPRGR